MMHTQRHWCLTEVDIAESLARMLTDRTWTLCTAFYIRGQEGYLFLNDATHEDGAGEYAVVKRLPDGTFLQVESITFSWCTEAKALQFIRDALAGRMDGNGFARPVTPRLDNPGQHGRCHLCV